MVHILLLILKIIGIILLTVLVLCLLVLFFPVTYSVKGQFHGNNYKISVRCGWLFHFLHFGGKFTNNQNIAKIRILGVPINLLKDKQKPKKEKYPEKDKKKKKEKRKKEKKQETATEEGVVTEEKQETKEVDREENQRTSPEKISEVQETEHTQRKDSKEEDRSRKSEDRNQKKRTKKSMAEWIKDFLRKVLSVIKQMKEKIKKGFHDVQGTFHKIKEMKNFISANTTKEAYRYGKRMIIKLLRHIFPRRIKAELHFGFEQPDATGKMLGYMGMIFAMLNVNTKRIFVIPDFDKKVMEGNIKLKGHFFISVVLVDILRFYFKKEIHDIIKKFS